MFQIRAVQLAALCICLLSAVSASSSHHKCPPGPDWHYFNGWCYSLSEDSDGWFGSEKTCQKLGGHLAAIGDETDNNFLQALGQCYQNFWIGMVKTDVRNRKFSWWNDAPANYTDPLQIRSDNYYDCVYFSAGSYGRWYNNPCQSLYQRLCMVPPREGSDTDPKALQVEKSASKDESNSQRKCPEGWLSIEGNCYYLSSKRTNYFNAQISCESMGATVASIKSHREQLLLTIAIGCDTKAWIGLEKVRPCISDSSRTFCWMWMDGSPDDSYSAWAPGHPSSTTEVECAFTQGRWYTTNCYNENVFVCMKK